MMDMKAKDKIHINDKKYLDFLNQAVRLSKVYFTT